MDQIMQGDVELLALRPEHWSFNFFETLRENLVYWDLVAHDYQGDAGKLGDTIHIPSIPQFDEASEIDEGERNDADAVVSTTQPLVINLNIVKDYIVTDRSQLQTIPAQNQLRDLATFAILKRMNRLIIDATIPSAASPDHQIPYDAGSTLGLADILEAKELLDTALVPNAPYRCMVLDTPQWNDLFNINGFVSSDFVSSRPNESGQPPVQIFGFLPKMSTEQNAVSTFFHPDYMNVVTQKTLGIKMYDRGGQGFRDLRFNLDLLMGLRQTSDIRVVNIS